MNKEVSEIIGEMCKDKKPEVTFYEAEDVAKQIDKDINVRSKDEPTTQTETQNSNLTFEKADEPQTDCNGCKFVGTYDTEFPCANCSRKTKDYYAKIEPQTERSE